MALHRLDSITLGVPDVAAAAEFYRDFGLLDVGDGNFATVDGGRQLSLVPAPTRRLVKAVFAVDDVDDLSRAERGLSDVGVAAATAGRRLTAIEPGTATLIELLVAPRVVQPRYERQPVNAPGRTERVNVRAAGVTSTDPVRPRRLGHIVLGSPNFDRSYAFFADALGFKVSDVVRGVGVFLRCSTDHHNVLIQRAPVPFVHHTSWQVEDVDAIGRGAMNLLAGHPDRHVWGLGRHYAGSNFFWYFKDPAGNFAEYHSDMDHIPEDALWTPETLDGARGLFQWGPPPPASFIDPEDLADLMISGHPS
ncbi:VOC family protein [Mycolicibacterium smegmatis]|uniref:2,3-dihydroxybiphenyl 1,2-dioxygenase n=1 Tax=Mycolicibacterium smegmatis (strain MKD8) TaxID=1214915 RepID=A0A2U9PIC4_MYCSE|nr:VOC family protein [Mycolicibacterium smegmatis]AWT51480.1 2,3-dihydroxybiphenyl 1,2-dioxygenase [Mycolicibacterium smegmatis MKD8]